MQPYYQNDGITLYCGDCREVIPQLNEQVSTVITDPPYGLEFMGKEWDKLEPNRSRYKGKDRQMIGENSGPGSNFESRMSAMPSFSGQKRNYKCTKCGKYKWDHPGRKCECDKPNFKTRHMGLEQQAFHQEWADILFDAVLPGCMLLSFGGTRTFHRLTCAIEDAGWEIRDCLMWLYGSGFPKSHDISKAIDKAKGEERKIISACIRLGDKKAYPHNSTSQIYGKDNDSLNDGWRPPITAPASALARQWHGYGTALKPAWEPIILAMKPLDGTFAQNAERHGVAGLWIDGGRIPANGRPLRIKNNDKGNENATVFHGRGSGWAVGSTSQGRFPANLILDEAAGAMLDGQSGNSKSTGGLTPGVGSKTQPSCWQFGNRLGSNAGGLGDSGGASRFFKTIKGGDQCEIVNIAERVSFLPNEAAAFVQNLVAIADNLAGKRLKDLIRHFINEIAKESEENSAKNTEKILNIGEKCLQELRRMSMERFNGNRASIAETQELTNTTLITQSLLNILGSAGHVTSESILRNLARGVAAYRSQATRFKYCAKASRSERGENNNHPTVKPLALMRYLCRLTKTPTGGLILDPFAGSGSTLIAAKLEGRPAIGIEAEEQYCEISARRLEADKQEYMKFDKPAEAVCHA